MKKSSPLSAIMGIGLALTCLAARGETVRTLDDKTTTGTITGLDHGVLLLQAKAGKPAAIRIPLTEIVEITLRPVATKPAAGAPPQVAAQPTGSAWSAIGNLLGISSGPSIRQPTDPFGDDAATESNDPPPADNDDSPAATPAPNAPPTQYYAPAAPAVPSTEAPAPAAAPPADDPFGAPSPAPTLPATAALAPASGSGYTAGNGTPVPAQPSATSRHPGVPSWRIELAGGDHFMAVLGGWKDKSVKLTLDSVLPSDLAPNALDVSEDQVRAIWSDNQTLVKKAQDLKPSSTAEDVAFVEKDGQVKTVAGVVAGIDGDSLKFKFEGEERKIKLQRLVGLMLAQREATPDKSPYQAFTFVNGDVLSGRIDAIEHNALLVKPLAVGAAARTVQIPLAQLATIEFKNGRLTWLGDLQPAGVVQIPYFDRLMPYRVNQSLTGGQLVLADGPITKGIAVHTKCVLRYDIGGAFEQFHAKVGFQQPEGKAGRAPVRIVGDGKTLWEAADLKGDASRPTAVDLNVAGVKTLTLEADYGPNQDVAGRIVWGEARLIKAPPKP